MEKSKTATRRVVKEIPQPVPHKPTPLTADQIRARHDVLVKIGRFKEANAMAVDVNAAVGANAVIDSVILSPANPFLSLYREFRSGQINADELETSIIASVCQNVDMLRDMEYKFLPNKPMDLAMAEGKLKEKLSGDQLMEATDKLHKKMASTDKAIFIYLKNFERIKSENASSLWWLEHWYEKSKDARLLGAISTHKQSSQ